MCKENIRKQYNKSKRYFVRYKGDTRYEKVWEQMQLLGIEDVTTERQHKNGTIIWRLPIRNNWRNGKFIEVGSFESGMVRNQNSAYSNYQLNKRCMSEPTYYKDYEWKNDKQVWTGKYRKFETRGCKLIPIEIDRLEYLISYCLKNYYIKRANAIANGELIHKWKHEHDLKTIERVNERANEINEYDKDGFSTYKSGQLDNLSVIVNGERYKII